jgi:benzodiazapine receptor
MSAIQTARGANPNPNPNPNPVTALTNRGVSLQQLKVANIVAYVLTVAMNGLAASGKLSKYKVGEVSDMYPTKITPASGAFGIWSIIYALEALFVVLPLLGSQPSSASEDAVLLHGIGFWFLLACLCNALWLIVFVQGTEASTWISTVLISMLLCSLCKIYVNAEFWVRRHPGRLVQRFLRTLVLDIHFSAYAGWVTVATIVNISAALSSTGWTGKPLTDTAWTVLMLCVALGLNCYIVISKQDCVWGWVMTWASAWIATANKGNTNTGTGDSTVVTASIIVSCISGVVSAVVGGKVLIGAWKSRNDDFQEDAGIDVKVVPLSETVEGKTAGEE